MEKQTDKLIDDLRRRKPAACQRLIADFGPAVLRMVQRIVTRREDAEEVYQDVFLKALRGIATYNPQQASLSTWLSRIAYNESLNFVRRQRAAIVYMDELDISLDDTPDNAPLDEETIARLERALALLPPSEQAVVSMFYYDGMSLADIAYVTGSIPSTVGSRLSRIRKKLYRIIKTMQL